MTRWLICSSNSYVTLVLISDNEGGGLGAVSIFLVIFGRVRIFPTL